MVQPPASYTRPPIPSTAGVHIRHMLTLWGINVFLTTLRPCCREFVMCNLYFAFELNPVGLQGTKVLEDREIRFRLCWMSEDVPPRHISQRIVKYTGTSTSPEWEDAEPGRVFSFPRYFVKALKAKRQVRNVMPCQG